MNVRLKTRIDKSGKLDLQIPTDLPNRNVEVDIHIKELSDEPYTEEGASRWPPDFFEMTYGSLADDPIERGPQGEYEEREF